MARKALLLLAPLATLLILGGGYYWVRLQQESPAPQEENASSAPAPDAPPGAWSPDGYLSGQHGTPTDNPQESSAGLPEATLPEDAPEPADLVDDRIPSDQQLLLAAEALTESPLLRALLSQEGFLRYLALAIDAVSQGDLPKPPPGFPAALAPFRAARNAGGWLAATPATQQRLAPWVAAIAAIPAEAVAKWLRLAAPKLQELLREAGDAQADDFPQRLDAALRHLAAIPEFDFDPELVPSGRPGLYDYKDPVFQNLSPAQKALVRTGPRNCEKIRILCEEVLTLLP